jgi:excisionase family DNA binding protein
MPTECKTMSVPEAGKVYFGLSRNGSYDAVKRGEIPVIRLGGKIRVPVVALEKMLADATPKPQPAA